MDQDALVKRLAVFSEDLLHVGQHSFKEGEKNNKGYFIIAKIGKSWNMENKCTLVPKDLPMDQLVTYQLKDLLVQDGILAVSISWFSST